MPRRFSIACSCILLLAACSKTTGLSIDDVVPLAPPSVELSRLSGFAGEYVIVDARRASDVAAPASFSETYPIGQVVVFDRDGLNMDGVSCENWIIEPTEEPVIFVESDRNLIDLTLGPTDSPNSAGDQQVHAAFIVYCEGEHFGRLHKVDDRILVMPWSNSSVNLILERRLSAIQIKVFQSQLKSMKFYNGELTGELDTATLEASRAWYEYRAAPTDTDPIPGRPAITENLLDGLRVLSE